MKKILVTGSAGFIGFHNLIEKYRNSNIRKLIYASSSSVYVLNKKYLLMIMIYLISLFHCMPQLKIQMSLSSFLFPSL